MDADVVEVGRVGPPGPRWPAALVAIAALAVGAFVVLHHHGSPTRRARPAATTAAFVTATAPVSVYDAGHPLLGSTGRWNLFGVGNGIVVRVEPARGRVTVTELPESPGGAAVSLIALPGRVVVRPVDPGPSYSVADGAEAVALGGPLGTRLRHVGPVFPGPLLGQEWVQTSPAGEDATVMTLIGADGRTIGPPVHVPADGFLSGDGLGHLAYTTRVNSEYYATSPGRWRVHTDGQLLAVGANRVVTAEHDPRLGYRMVVTDVPNGSRHAFAAHGFVADPVLGTVSPDGRTAAVLSGSFHATTVVLVDLRTGIERDPAVAVSEDDSLGWSPDGHWLLAVTAAGHVVAVDARTAAVHPLGASLPPLSQLLVRPAPAR